MNTLNGLQNEDMDTSPDSRRKLQETSLKPIPVPAESRFRLPVRCGGTYNNI